MTMTLTEIENLSPVEIKYHYSVDGEGQYNYGSRCISIDKDLEYNVKIECLLHEIGHAIHDANGCRCMASHFDHTLAEYHAMKFAMKYIRNNSALIRVFVDKVIFELKCGDSEHKTAAKRIVKLKQWKKLCKVT